MLPTLTVLALLVPKLTVPEVAACSDNVELSDPPTVMAVAALAPILMFPSVPLPFLAPASKFKLPPLPLVPPAPPLIDSDPPVPLAVLLPVPCSVKLLGLAAVPAVPALPRYKLLLVSK